jgi:hypothetical protein
MGEPSAAAEKFIMERIDTHDPRAERLWELVAILRGTPASPQGRAYRFLFEALRARQAKHKASVRPARA